MSQTRLASDPYKSQSSHLTAPLAFNLTEGMAAVSFFPRVLIFDDNGTKTALTYDDSGTETALTI